MCGIIGTTDVKISLEKFKEAHKTIYHRGPDNKSYVVTDDFIFGHVRLSIIDLDERANQPFVYEFGDKKITVVFNGEVYNFLDLKKILSKKGYTFATSSDTEVLCASYCEWGIDCFNYFEGMWAVGLYDHGSRQFLMSRDRVGKKPLYYSFENGNLSFASSIWGVAKLTGNKTISKQGLQLYFALGFTPDNYSIVEGIYKLIPGKIIVFQKEEDGFVLIKESMSSFENSSTKKFKISDLIKKAVEKRIISDVPIATLMSGGVDSTIVTTITKSLYPKTKTFFVDFEEKKLSEFFWASYLAKRNKIQLNRVYLKNEELNESFNLYTKVYEEPFADYSGIPSIAILKKVAEEFKVVLTGDGGDELFYGYPHYTKKMLLYIMMKFNNIIKISQYCRPAIREILNGGIVNFEGNYLKNHAVLTPFAFEYINKRFNDILEREKSFLKGLTQYDREFNNLPEKYLVKTDRASMYSGIEVRSPFLDEALLKEVKRKPVWKIFTPVLSKLYLKIIYFRFFGVKYLLSKKQGFTPPIKELRNAYFKEIDFDQLKEKLKNIDFNFFKEIENLCYNDLLNDTILFDRFFFFNIWFDSSYNENV